MTGDAHSEAVLAHPLRQHSVDVDIRGHQLRMAGIAFGLGQQGAVLVHHAVAVPGQVGGRFAHPRGRVYVAGKTPGRLTGAQGAAVFVLADQSVGRAEVDEDGRPGQRAERGRGDGGPPVLAHFDMEHGVARPEQELRTERDGLAAHRDRPGHERVARGELAQLIELPVVRQIRLGHQPANEPTMDDRGHVGQHPVDDQGQAHYGNGGKGGGGGPDLFERDERGFKERSLVEQVVAGVGREPEFGEGAEADSLGCSLPEEFDRGRRIVRGIGDAHLGNGHGDAQETVGREVVVGVHRAEGYRPSSPSQTAAESGSAEVGGVVESAHHPVVAEDDQFRDRSVLGTHESERRGARSEVQQMADYTSVDERGDPSIGMGGDHEFDSGPQPFGERGVRFGAGDDVPTLLGPRTDPNRVEGGGFDPNETALPLTEVNLP